MIYVTFRIESRPAVEALRLARLSAGVFQAAISGVPQPVVRLMRDEVATETRAARAMRDVRAAGERMLAARVNARDELFAHGERREMRRRGWW